MTKLSPALLVAFLLIPCATTPCGLTATCSDVNASLSGQVIIEGYRVTWSTDDAGSTVGHYRLMRYPYGSPGLIRQIGADVATYVDCTSHSYSRDDTSVTSGSWIYLVQVWPATGSEPTCAYELPVTIP